MDQSEKYINMCKEATDLHKMKWEYGFVPGDWVYLGKELTTVIGFDLLNISHSIIEDKHSGIQSLKLELAHCNNIDINVNNKDIDITVMEYPVDSYINPIWLPRQDQLETFYYRSIIEKTDVHDWIECLYEQQEDFYHYHFTSVEQLSLAIIMLLKFQLYWHGDKWKSEPAVITPK